MGVTILRHRPKTLSIVDQVLGAVDRITKPASEKPGRQEQKLALGATGLQSSSANNLTVNKDLLDENTSD